MGKILSGAPTASIALNPQLFVVSFFISYLLCCAMFKFTLKRLALIIPTLIGVVFLAFWLIRLVPGDPIEIRMGERGIPAERLMELRHELGLDLPLWQQFLSYCLSALKGDFGVSLVTKAPVLQEFFTLFPATVELSLVAILFALLFGLPAGLIAAKQRGSAFDHGLMGVSLAGYSLPIFWWGPLMILLFSVLLGLTPVSGRLAAEFYIEPVTGFMLIDCWGAEDEGVCLSALSHLILPGFVLGTIPLAIIARMTRSAMLEVLAEDYVRTARAKGLAPVRVLGVHALRNALIPVVTVIGLQVGVLLAGAILTETIFAWPGIGKWLVDSIARRDYPALQGGVLLVAMIVITVNLVVDLLYGVLNPRIRRQ
jgi:dipeptide transport system permease protein